MSLLYLQSVQTALQEVDSALVTRVKSGEREHTLGRQVSALKDVVGLARIRYEGGQASFMEVLDADFKLNSAVSFEAQSRRDTFLALISVYKSMGGGWMVEQDRLRAPAIQASGVPMAAATEARAEK